MKYILLATGFFAIGLAAPGFADISFSQKITIDAAGGMSMFGSEGHVLTQIAGDSSRSESTMKMNSRIASMAMGSGRTTTIVRIDKGLAWQLDMENESYKEMTFAESRKQMEQARKSMEQSGSGQLPVSEEGCQWSEAKVDVEHVKGSEDVAGIKTKKHTIRLEQSCTDPETGNTCDITWLMDTWLAKKVPGEKEALKFRKAYAEALGMDEAMSQFGGMGQSLLSMYAKNWDDVLEEFEKMKGYPLKMAMQMGMGGEQCKTSTGEPIAMDDTWQDASTAVYDNALNSMSDSLSNSIGSSVAGALGGGKAGAAAGRLVKGLGGMFNKKSAEPEPTPAPEPESQVQQVTANDQLITLFRMTTEMTNWSKISIPADRFEIPQGWDRN